MVYHFFNDPYRYRDALPCRDFIRQNLSGTHGIICPADCYCRDEVVFEKCNKAAAMSIKWVDAMSAGDQDQVMQLTDNLLVMADEIEANCNFAYMALVNGGRFILHNLRSESELLWCGEKLGRALPMARTFFHPSNEQFKELDKAVKRYNHAVELAHYERKRRGEPEVHRQIK